MSVTPEEARLLKSLESLENLHKGGDALQNAPHDGGLSMEGTNIQSKNKAMKKALKALIKSGMDQEKASALLKAVGGKNDDDDSSPDAPPPMRKGGDDDDSSDEMDDEDDAGDDSSSEEPEMPMSKSERNRGASQLANASSKHRGGLRKALAAENPAAEAAFDAAPILGQLVDAIDRLSRNQAKQLQKSLNGGGESDDLRKSIGAIYAYQKDFNSKTAQAFSMLASKLGGMEARITSLLAQPARNQGSPTLRKSDVREPQFNNGDTSAFDGSTPISPLAGIERIRVQEELVDMCQKGQVDILDVTRFENAKGDFTLLPPAVVKRLEAKFCPA